MDRFSALAPRRVRHGRRRWLRRLGRVLVLALILTVFGPVTFVVTQCYGDGPAPAPLAGPLAAYPEAQREESYTFLTLPEWLIVYSTEEYARWITRQRPSGFPHLAAATQYWSAYRDVCRVTRGHYQFQTGYHVMLGVIGASFTVENAIKGVYENTLGRFTEWVASTDTDEDRWAARTALEYGRFMHTVPWYQFPFASRLGTLWSDTPLWGPHILRKLERRVALTAEYSFKAAYGGILRMATQSAYAPEMLHIYAHVTSAPPHLFDRDDIRRVAALGETEFVVLLPRYEAFTTPALALLAAGARFVSIAGNDELMIGVLVSDGRADMPTGTTVVSRLPLVSDPSTVRLALRVPVAALPEAVTALKAQNAIIERFYDY